MASTSDIALPWLRSQDYTMHKNLLPNMYPTMDARTGKFGPGQITIHADSQYASGLLYIHSSQHNPDGFDVTGDWEHIWYTYHNIEVSKVVVGIPDPYFDDCARGHALYVTGLAPGFTSAIFEGLFSSCGDVRHSVAVIDQNSGETFRWVVMRSFEEAQKAIDMRNGMPLGSHTINVCRAFAPGKAIPLLGRTISQIYHQQHLELIEDDIMYARAVFECMGEKSKPAENCEWFNTLLSAKTTPVGSAEGVTVESSLVGFVPPEGSPEARKKKLFKQAEYSPNFEKLIVADHQARLAAAANQTQVGTNGNTPTSAWSNDVRQEVDYSASPHPNSSPSSGSGASTIIPSVATPTPIIAIPAIARPSAAPAIAIPVAAATSIIAPPSTTPAPVATVPVVAATSWANIAAPSSNESHNLVFNLHPENKPTSSAPRVQARVSPNVVAHQHGESLEEQMRTVLIFNLPNNITLTDVSEAIREGPVLMITFGTDTETGKKYVGIVFQYAHDANAFYQHLLHEKATSTPGRFRFIVEAGQGPPYAYDELLEDMDHPMLASRRLTIVKKGFFFQFGKKHLRKLCVDLVGANKLQLVWLYNGGNASVVFADVKSAVAVKILLDQKAVSKAKGGPNMVSFEGLTTTFSKDPCVADMNLVTDIPDHNED